MKALAGAVAQKLLNLYRQEHVIIGGWATVNKVFVAEATDDVIAELRELPTGNILIQHIENLRTGKTPMDTISRELLPYGGRMGESGISTPLSGDELRELERAMDAFTTDTAGLDALQQSPVIKKFGEEWIVGIRAALAAHPELLNKWATITKTYQAYRLWDSATTALSKPLSERGRAQLQADMPAYETYLPMFGADGDELLSKLRNLISNVKPSDVA